MRTPVSVRAATALYGFSLRLLPESFRTQFGEEMRWDTSVLFRERWDVGGVWGVLMAAGGALMDVGNRALIERRARRARARRDGVNHGMGEMMMNWMRTLRLAVRSLTRKPGFTAAAAVTLGVGLGSVVAIFTLVNAILLQPLPFPEADRLVSVDHHAPGIDLPRLNNSPGTLDLYWSEADFMRVAGVNRAQRVLTGRDRPARVSVLQVTEQYFDVMQVQVAQGRPMTDEDNREGASPVAVLTHEFWANRFGSDPGLIGRTIDLDGVATEVVGILPPDYQHINAPPDLLTPMGYLDPDDFGSFGINGVARLEPGVGLEQARAQLVTLNQRLPDRDPDLDAAFLEAAGWSASLTPLKEAVVGDLETTLWLVLGTVGFVLLIACANVANLFLVRGGEQTEGGGRAGRHGRRAKTGRRDVSQRGAGAGRGRWRPGCVGGTSRCRGPDSFRAPEHPAAERSGDDSDRGALCGRPDPSHRAFPGPGASDPLLAPGIRAGASGRRAGKQLRAESEPGPQPPRHGPVGSGTGSSRRVRPDVPQCSRTSGRGSGIRA